MSETTPSPNPAGDVGADGDPNDRVHHHARIGDEHPAAADGTFVTLCGLRIRPRPDAAELPCCPMCGLTKGRPCR